MRAVRCVVWPWRFYFFFKHSWRLEMAWRGLWWDDKRWQWYFNNWRFYYFLFIVLHATASSSSVKGALVSKSLASQHALIKSLKYLTNESYPTFSIETHSQLQTSTILPVKSKIKLKIHLMGNVTQRLYNFQSWENINCLNPHLRQRSMYSLLTKITGKPCLVLDLVHIRLK